MVWLRRDRRCRTRKWLGLVAGWRFLRPIIYRNLLCAREKIQWNVMRSVGIRGGAADAAFITRSTYLRFFTVKLVPPHAFMSFTMSFRSSASWRLFISRLGIINGSSAGIFIFGIPGKELGWVTRGLERDSFGPKLKFTNSKRKSIDS